MTDPQEHANKDAILAALRKSPPGEVVAWRWRGKGTNEAWRFCDKEGATFEDQERLPNTEVQPLFAAPPQAEQAKEQVVCLHDYSEGHAAGFAEARWAAQEFPFTIAMAEITRIRNTGCGNEWPKVWNRMLNELCDAYEALRSIRALQPKEGGR